MDALRTTTTRLWAVVLLGLVAGLLPVMSPSPALADAGLEQQFVGAINAERSAAGLAGLTPAGDLTTAARRHAGTMASAEHLHHNPGLGTAVGGWQKIGENVGRGPAVGVIHQAFMDSPGHRRNVLDPAFTEVGIGVVVRDGQIWVTEMFRLPSSAVPAAPAPAATEPAESKPATPEPTESEPAAPASDATSTPGASPGPDDATAGASDPAEATSDDPVEPAGESAAGEPEDTGDDDGPGDVPIQQDRMLMVQMRLVALDA